MVAFEELERFGRVYTGGKVAVSHDGSYLVCSCGDELKIVDVASGKVKFAVTSEEDDFTTFALHPAKHEMVTASRSRQLRHYSLDLSADQSECIRSWKAHKMPVADLAYESTGTLVASAGADGTVMVFDVAKGFATHVFRGHSGVVHRVMFHPDSKKLQVRSFTRQTEQVQHILV